MVGAAFLLLLCVALVDAQQLNPFTHNGGSILAMAGKDCVALAVDKRFGQQNSLVAVRNRPIVPLFGSHTLVAFAGFERDVQSLSVELTAQVARLTSSRGLGFSVPNGGSSGSSSNGARDVSVESIALLTSHILYQQRCYFVESIIVGLSREKMHSPPSGSDDDDGTIDDTSSSNDDLVQSEKDNDDSTIRASSLLETRRQRQRQYRRPYLCSMDAMGAMSTSDAFCCAGTALPSLYGTAEALWRPHLEPHELLHVCAQAFTSALERDAMSGYGAVIYMLTSDGAIVEYDILGRSD